MKTTKPKERRKPFMVYANFILAKGARELMVWQGLEYSPAIALRRAVTEMWRASIVKWKHVEEAHFNVKGISHAQYANLVRQEAGSRRK